MMSVPVSSSTSPVKYSKPPRPLALLSRRYWKRGVVRAAARPAASAIASSVSASALHAAHDGSMVAL